MATNYPGAIDSLTNPSSGDALTSPSHSAQHANANDAIEAIETELGTDPAGASATVKARFEAIEANDWVTSAKIAADAVGTSEIAANAVGSSELADNAVDTAAIADGAVTAVKILIGAATVGSGTGTPEGVVTAAPGSTWLQTDATTDVKGWIKWVKATGTGNTGWVAGPEADTGWRDVSGLLINGWQKNGAYGHALVRRVGPLVEVRLSLTGTSATLDGCLSTFGAGMGASEILSFMVSTGATTVASVLTSAAWGTECAARGYIHGSFFYLNPDAWPTSLPGVAA